jgi:hypothetical protein
MQTRVTDRPIQQVMAAIQALDLESVKLRLTDTKLGEGWTRAYADSIEVAYKNYLIMLAKYQEDAEDILLAEDVDEFWHAHILQTMKYVENCESAFGRYLHHAPHVGEVTAADLDARAAKADKTRRLYQKEFGGERDGNAAWSGGVDKAGEAAFSGAAVKAVEAAFSGAAIGSERAAFSGAAIRAEEAAFSGTVIRAEKAAFSGAAISAAADA